MVCVCACVRACDYLYLYTAGIDIEGGEGLVVGSDAALRCVSVSPATMIQWINNAGVEVAMTTTGLTLDLPFAPVTDTLHNSEFTCRVTRSTENGGTGELSATLTVTGEA